MGTSEYEDGRIIRFAFHEVLRIVQEARIRSTACVCRKYGVTPSMLSLWRRQYAGVPSHALRLLLVFEHKNRMLRKRLAEKEAEIRRLMETSDEGGGEGQDYEAKVAGHLDYEFSHIQ